MTLARKLYDYTAGKPCRLIHRRGGEPYLERYRLVYIFGFEVYLHRFVDADVNEGFHDHPWRAFSLCLTGGYMEDRLRHLDPEVSWEPRCRCMWPGRLSRLGLATFHRIVSTRPETWTLFVHGPRRKGWGFLDGDAPNRRVIYRMAGSIFQDNPWDEAVLGRDSERAPFGST
ncbi:MAG: hypothetical protein L0H29_01030 [Sinobacteraceae bacterium]|nr:hypothetical protein [Nevskiaceae bacterium]